MRGPLNRGPLKIPVSPRSAFIRAVPRGAVVVAEWVAPGGTARLLAPQAPDDARPAINGTTDNDNTNNDNDNDNKQPNSTSNSNSSSSSSSSSNSSSSSSNSSSSSSSSSSTQRSARGPVDETHVVQKKCSRLGQKQVLKSTSIQKHIF